MPRLTQEQLEAIRQRAENATPGPWQIATTTDGAYALDTDDMIIAATIERTEDATFIAHARTDIPALLDHIAELETLINIIREIAAEGYATACTSDEARAYGSILDVLNRKEDDQ